MTRTFKNKVSEYNICEVLLIRYCDKKYLFSSSLSLVQLQSAFQQNSTFTAVPNGCLRFDVVKELRKESYDALVPASQRKDGERMSSDAKHFELWT